MTYKNIFILLVLLSSNFSISQESTPESSVANDRELLEEAISLEASSANAAADRQNYIDNLDSQIIQLIGDIQFLSQQLDLTNIYNSRTFCLYDDIEDIKSKGLAKGGSLENAIVVNSNGILNTDGLRNSKEFVNHKILDCIGDLYTSGYRIIGSIICSQGGHYLTNQLLKKLFKDRENFSIIEIQERNLPHNLINRSLLRSIA